ncbi:Protein of unknown function (DUF1666 [Striga hermonthica]|uniref:Ribosomal protein L34Ae n=1 Tax=Striga hermonthica TaxID=68872 RepID=A0A9N7NDK9_STRHE|nr:Protein of unknown function (DUF1666 [Striga hermonthica]
MAGFSSLFLCQKLVYLVHAVIGFVFSSVFRIRLKAAQESGVLDKDGKKIDFLEPEDGAECGDFGVRSEEEDEPEEICLKFKFPTFEEFSKTHEGIGNYSKFEPAIVDEIEDFVVKEEIDGTGEFITDGNFDEEFDRTCGGHEEGEEILVVDRDENEKTVAKIEFQETSDEEFDLTGEKGENIQVESGANIEFQENSESKVQTIVQEDELTDDDENHLSSDKISMIADSDSDSDSTSFEHIRSVMTRLVGPQTDGFLSDGDFGVEPPESENEKTETFSELSIFDENQDSSDDFSDEDSDIMDELAKLEEDSDSKNLDTSSSGFLSFDDFNDKFETNGDEKVEKSSTNDFSEDEEELESLWEHQELIEQLKMELKKVRATGLPTILEESESPKLMDDLKPWKIDEFQREKNCSAGLHKFYKSYREKMRKFDIINYQKMYAMGFLQLKDPMKSVSTHKPSPPTLKSLVSQNLWLFKHKIHGTDPMKKFVQELQGDLEAVYVGQTSLSWEFLHWQYEKVLDLWESDPSGARTYNEVAGEFQQFQVLVQRFLEDEPFQGPRVQNYVKTRCAVRNLLQVPIIREDKRKVRTKATGEYFITTEMLVETVEESIRIFWRFVRADKDCSIASLNNGHKRTPELLSTEDLELFAELKRSLLKKERKIKDILRSENCILRKFRQCREDDSSEDQVLYFFSQVDMKLVCRVLNMSKITREQLIWCRNKLNRISFVNRRIHVEPAFLLFPC